MTSSSSSPTVLGQSPALPSEIIYKIAQYLHRDEQLHTLAVLQGTSRQIRDLIEPLLYTRIEVDDTQLHSLIKAHTRRANDLKPRSRGSGDNRPDAKATNREPEDRQSPVSLTNHLNLLSPLSTTTAALIRSNSLAPFPFPALSTLSIAPSVLKSLPQGSLSSQYDSSRGFKHKKEALCHLGPFETLYIGHSSSERDTGLCIFTILHPILPTSVGLSSFLPSLKWMRPSLRKVVYERWDAELIYPTGGIMTIYSDPCGCWIQHGAERMGLGLSLAWAQERRGEGRTKVKIVIGNQEDMGEWDRFGQRVLKYMQDGGQDLTGRTTTRNGILVIDCLEFSQDATSA